MAQWIAHWTSNPEVAGSNPVKSVYSSCEKKKYNFTRMKILEEGAHYLIQIFILYAYHIREKYFYAYYINMCDYIYIICQYGRVVKAIDLKSIGLCPRRF